MTTCPHGDHPSCCLDCIDAVPNPPKPTRHPTEHTMQAMYEGRCAVDDRHAIEEGQTIGLVDGLGWACFRCVERS